MPDANSKIQVNLIGRDQLTAERKTPEGPWHVEARACGDLLQLLRQLASQNADPSAWPLPKGNSHQEMLVRELILRMREQWVYPLQHTEVCHCRAVTTETVDQAVIGGAHTIAEVRRCTSANTACGTCKPDIEAIIKFRLYHGDPREEL